MGSNTLIKLISIFFFLFPLLVQSRMSIEERQRLKDEADEADHSIKFVKFDEIAPTIAEAKVALIFFGANWCVNTQRYSNA